MPEPRPLQASIRWAEPHCSPLSRCLRFFGRGARAGGAASSSLPSGSPGSSSPPSSSSPASGAASDSAAFWPGVGQGTASPAAQAGGRPPGSRPTGEQAEVDEPDQRELEVDRAPRRLRGRSQRSPEAAEQANPHRVKAAVKASANASPSPPPIRKASEIERRGSSLIAFLASSFRALSSRSARLQSTPPRTRWPPGSRNRSSCRILP